MHQLHILLIIEYFKTNLLASSSNQILTCISDLLTKTADYLQTIYNFVTLSSSFSEADFDPDSYKIPFVVMSLSTLATEVHSLLQSHEGSLPLLR